MKKDSIRVACQGAGSLSIDLLTPLQGRLKVLPEANYKKLKAEILHDGFIEPVSVWEGEGQVYVLNGHQRLETLRRMKGEGYKVPQVPVNYVEADNIQDAKRKVLALASQYGVVDQEGLFDFVNDAGIGVNEVRDRFEFADFDTERFLKEHFGQASQPSAELIDGISRGEAPNPLADGEDGEPESAKGSSEISAEDFDAFDHKCPRCQFEFND